jgi:hypothetical protein
LFRRGVHHPLVLRRREAASKDATEEPRRRRVDRREPDET